MSDIRLVYDNVLGVMDLAIEDDDIARDAGLETSVLISLFSDRRAADEDVLIDPEDKRGWWGDQFGDVDGDLIGSGLWQLERALLIPDVEVQTEVKVRESLAWMIEDEIAATIDVDVTTDDETKSLCLSITINQPTGEQLNFRYTSVWEAQSAV